MSRLKGGFAPKQLEKLIRKSFRYGNHGAFAQIATIGKGQQPEVRTVHVHFSPLVQTLLFNTNRHTKKVSELLRTSKMAGCYYDRETNTQLRWKGSVKLVSKGRTSEEIEFLEDAWRLISPRTRKAYWQNYSGGGDVNERCPDCITMIIHPVWWDVLQLNATDYLKSKRTISRLKNGRWHVTSVYPLTGVPKR